MSETARTALVTGAGRGIGLATARRFARAKMNVVLMARSAADLERAAATLGGRPDARLIVAGDVGREDDVERAVGAAARRFGRIDVLVNNAGAAPLSPIDEMSVADFDKMLAVNVRGVFLLCRAAWPVMKRGGGGTIINVSSLSARDPFPGFAAYGGSKAFVETFTLALAGEGRPHNIRVLGVAPGAVDTAMLRAAFPDYPASNCLDPDDVAATIEEMCEPDSRFESGQTIPIERA